MVCKVFFNSPFLSLSQYLKTNGNLLILPVRGKRKPLFYNSRYDPTMHTNEDVKIL